MSRGFRIDSCSITFKSLKLKFSDPDELLLHRRKETIADSLTLLWSCDRPRQDLRFTQRWCQIVKAAPLRIGSAGPAC